MNLTDKITSREDYDKVTYSDRQRPAHFFGARGYALWRQLQVARPDPLRLNAIMPAAMAHVPLHVWWMHREDARYQYLVYERNTTVLNELHATPQFAHFFIHISLNDPALIAFTPSHADGCIDRQVHMSLGRFLRKYSNFLSDTEIATLEARHRSELNPDVKLHSFIDDWTTCLNIYKGIGSCMSKPEESYPQADVHPVSVYKAPGFYLAALYNGNGQASARCVVWINPKDEKDKRWVRVYGDVVLNAWLKKNGFLPKPFTGAFLYTHVLPGQSNSNPVVNSKKILMGYVDQGSDREERDHNRLAIWDGGNRVYMINSRDVSKYPAAFAPQSTSGYLSARMTPIHLKSLISGEEFNGMDEPFVNVRVNGVDGYARKGEAKGFLPVNVAVGTTVLMPPDTKVFTHKGDIWPDTEEIRHAIGYYKFEASLYPDEQDWQFGMGANVKSANGWIKYADAVKLIVHDGGAQLKLIHKNTLPDDAVRCAAIDEVATYAMPQVTIVRTTANRKVVPHIHPVVQLYNGDWMYTRHTITAKMFGTVVFVPKEGAEEALKLIGLPVPIKEAIKQIAESAKRNDVVVRKVLYTYLMDMGDVFVPLDWNREKNEFSWSYVWAASEIKVESVRALLNADKPIHVGATEAAVSVFKSRAKLLIDEIDACWAAKAAAEKLQPATAATA